MGVDLTILPFFNESMPGESLSFAHTNIVVAREQAIFHIFEIAQTRHGRDVPENFRCYLATGPYGDPCYGTLTEDPYGDNLQYVRAMHVKPALAGYTSRYWKNRALAKYILELPDELAIAIYWH